MRVHRRRKQKLLTGYVLLPGFRENRAFYRRQRFTVLVLPASIASEGEEPFFHRLLG